MGDAGDPVVVVRFNAGHSPYQAGDEAGFSEEIAERLGRSTGRDPDGMQVPLVSFVKRAQTPPVGVLGGGVSPLPESGPDATRRYLDRARREAMAEQAVLDARPEAREAAAAEAARAPVVPVAAPVAPTTPAPKRAKG